MLDEKCETIDPAGVNTDRRAGAKRHQSVLLVGKVVRGDQVDACLVHDISRRGLMARFPTPPVVGESLMIEVRGLPPIAATVRWVNGRKAGLQFDEAQPVEQVFQVKRADGLTARAPRFPLEAAGLLRINGLRLPVTTLDISVGGIKLVVEDAVQPGQTGQITMVDTNTSLFGKICWVRDNQCGFRFIAPLPLDAMARILAG